MIAAKTRRPVGTKKGPKVMPASGKVDTDRKVELLKARIQNAITLGFEKAVAHRENPSAYPLPAGGKSVERAFHRLLESLPNGKRKKLIEKINETRKASATARKSKYQDLANVDFKSAVAVVDQVKSMAVPESIKFTEVETNELVARVRARVDVPTKTVGNGSPLKPGKKNGVARQKVTATNLAFVVDSMTCLKPDDLIKDEINLAGFSIDTNGNSVELAPLFVGKFKKNDTLALGGNSKLFTLPIDPLLVPQTFTAGLFIIESDLVRNQELLDALLDLCIVISSVGSILTLPVFALTLAFAPGALLPLAIAVLGIAVASLIGKLLAITLGDDISLAVTDTLVVEEKIEIGQEFARTFNVEKVAGGFSGNYTISGRWVGEA